VPEVGVDNLGTSTTLESNKSLREYFCLCHALLKLPKKLTAIASPLRQSLRTQFHTLLYR